MNLDLNSILGERLFDGRSSGIYRNGIAHDKDYLDYILWENVEVIYVSGTKRTFYEIPSSEDRMLAFIDTHGKRIDFYLSSLFRMKEEAQQQFNSAYSFVLQNTSGRQWTKFISGIRNGERLTFGAFEVTKDAFYFKKLFRRYKQIDISYIKGCYLKAGYFFILYQQPLQKLKSKNVGSIGDIPNIHLAQMFINEISKKAVRV